ncbi:MAG TPA: GAF domain-containing sensor histidine kinase [Dehalococcoidia bacterium]|nr:GAF domain-containing sensor histidine kinase [Dehalococcoidia bacterium]
MQRGAEYSESPGRRSGESTLVAGAGSPALTAYLDAVRTIAEAASGDPEALDPTAIAHEAAQAMVRITGLSACAIYLAERKAGRVRCLTQTGYPQLFLDRYAELPLDGDSLTARALRSGEPQYSGVSAPGVVAQDVLSLVGANTFVIVPFHSGGQVSGTINVAGVRPETPGADEVALLQIVAEQVGHAVITARLHRESAEAGERARFLAEVSRGFNASLELADVLETVCRRAVGVLGDWCVIYLRDEARELMEMRAVQHREPARAAIVRRVFAANPVKVGEGVAGTVVLSGEPRVFRAFGEEQIRTLAPRDDEAYMNELRQVCSWACLPLIQRGHGLGAIVVARADRELDDDDLEFASAFAGIAAGAIANARLYEAERALRRVAEAAQAELAAVDRQKDEFLSVASHELRTPLTSAQGFAQVLLRRLQRQPQPDAGLIEGLSVVEGQLRRIGALLSDLLDFSRIQTGSLPLHASATDLVALTRAVVERSRLAPGGERIALAVPAAPVQGVWDPQRIEQIVVNLLENAIRYSPNGGAIEVSVGAEGDEAVLRVRDHGLGVPAASLARLFQRFYRVPDEQHRQISGIGVGLFISRTIAEQHSGTLTVEQPDGPGARFVLRLPLAPPAAVDFPATVG